MWKKYQGTFIESLSFLPAFCCHIWTILLPYMSHSAAIYEPFCCHIWIILLPYMNHSAAIQDWEAKTSTVLINQLFCHAQHFLFSVLCCSAAEKPREPSLTELRRVYLDANVLLQGMLFTGAWILGKYNLVFSLKLLSFVTLWLGFKLLYVQDIHLDFKVASDHVPWYDMLDCGCVVWLVKLWVCCMLDCGCVVWHVRLWVCCMIC